MWWTLHKLTEGMNFDSYSGNISKAINCQYWIYSLNLRIFLNNNTREIFSLCENIDLLIYYFVQRQSSKCNHSNKYYWWMYTYFYCCVCILLPDNISLISTKELHYKMEYKAYTIGLIWYVTFISKLYQISNWIF